MSWLLFILIYYYPNICFKSSSGVLIRLIPKLSTKNCNTLGLKKVGKLGPRYIPLMPNESNAYKSVTAFCSYQDSIIDKR